MALLLLTRGCMMVHYALRAALVLSDFHRVCDPWRPAAAGCTAPCRGFVVGRLFDAWPLLSPVYRTSDLPLTQVESHSFYTASHPILDASAACFATLRFSHLLPSASF